MCLNTHVPPLQEIAELDRQLNGLNAHLADLAGLRELQGSSNSPI